MQRSSPAPRGPLAQRQLAPPLGQLLLEKGLIDEAGLERALDHKKRTGQKLGQCLVDLMLLSEAGLAEALRWQGRLTCISLTPRIVDAEVARELSEDEARQLGAIPINRIAGVVTVALEDPSDIFALDELSRQLKGRIFGVYAEPARIRECIQAIHNPAVQSFSVRERERGRFQAPERTEPAAATAPWEIRQQLPEVMQALFEAAVAADANCLHFEPGLSGFTIRMRLRHGLRERQQLPAEWTGKALSWLKELAGLDPGVSDRALEGRGDVAISGNEYVASVAIVPSAGGDSAVVRLTPRLVLPRGLEGLDLGIEQEQALALQLAAGQGLILSVGPAGSGRVGALHGMLRTVARPDRKVIALEDPVEARFEHVVHVSAQSLTDRTQAGRMRTLLRHDPDVLLVTTLENAEAAEVALAASSQGLLVLAGLRAHGFADAVKHLRGWGLGNYALAHTLRGAVVQRSLRRVCPACTQPAEPCSWARLALERMGLDDPQLLRRQGPGCEACRGRGFLDVLPVREFAFIDEGLAEALACGAPRELIGERIAAQLGTSLAARAFEAVRTGECCIEDVLRAIA